MGTTTIQTERDRALRFSIKDASKDAFNVTFIPEGRILVEAHGGTVAVLNAKKVITDYDDSEKLSTKNAFSKRTEPQRAFVPMAVNVDLAGNPCNIRIGADALLVAHPENGLLVSAASAEVGVVGAKKVIDIDRAGSFVDGFEERIAEARAQKMTDAAAALKESAKFVDVALVKEEPAVSSVTPGAFEIGHVFTQEELQKNAPDLLFLKGYTYVDWNKQNGQIELMSPELFPGIKPAKERIGEGRPDFAKGKELTGSCDFVISYRDRLNKKCAKSPELKGMEFRLATDKDWEQFAAGKFKAAAGAQKPALALEAPADETLQESNLGGREYYVASQGGDSLTSRFATVRNDTSGEKRTVDKRDVQAGGRLFVTVPGLTHVRLRNCIS